MWVKVGVRKLVSMDGVTVSMTEHERNIVTQNYSSTVTRPSTGAGHHETVAVYRNNESVHTPSPASWDMERETELNQTGRGLLDDIGWDWYPSNGRAPDTPVRNWWILPAVSGKHAPVD